MPLALLLTVASPAPSPPGADSPLILFLVDNSASLPPLDPEEKRVAALEKMFGFLRGQRYRLILFGGKGEVTVDEVSRYRNDGQFTDFYHAFLKARELADSYRKGTDIRMVLLTDAIVDPDPADWPDVPKGEDLRAHSIRRTIELLREMGLSLYVVLVGDTPPEGVVRGDPEQSPGFVRDMVRAANGAAAAPTAQSLASFFGDDGLLLKKFIYRVEPHEGLRQIEPVVRRIAAPPRAGIELRIFGYFVLPLTLILLALLGVLVRSFPGPGDREIVELALGQPLHVGVDRLHRTRDGGWAAQGLSLVGEAREAAATFTLQSAELDLTGRGLDVNSLDPADRRLLPLGLDEMRRSMETATESGTREEKIHALNLDYLARNMRPQDAERILLRPVAERSRVAAVDFVRAKAHLAFNDALRQRLGEPRVHVVTYGKDPVRRALTPGTSVRLGRYGFLVEEVGQGGRKDARLVLHYDRVPSLFGLKTILPDAMQRALRFRRSRHRVVG